MKLSSVLRPLKEPKAPVPPPPVRDDDAQEWGRATGGAGVDVTQKKKWEEGIAAERKGVFLYWADRALNKEVYMGLRLWCGYA